MFNVSVLGIFKRDWGQFTWDFAKRALYILTCTKAYVKRCLLLDGISTGLYESKLIKKCSFNALKRGIKSEICLF